MGRVNMLNNIVTGLTWLYIEGCQSESCLINTLGTVKPYKILKQIANGNEIHTKKIVHHWNQFARDTFNQHSRHEKIMCLCVFHCSWIQSIRYRVCLEFPTTENTVQWSFIQVKKIYIYQCKNFLQALPWIHTKEMKTRKSKSVTTAFVITVQTELFTVYVHTRYSWHCRLGSWSILSCQSGLQSGLSLRQDQQLLVSLRNTHPLGNTHLFDQTPEVILFDGPKEAGMMVAHTGTEGWSPFGAWERASGSVVLSCMSQWKWILNFVPFFFKALSGSAIRERFEMNIWYQPAMSRNVFEAWWDLRSCAQIQVAKTGLPP